MQVYEAYDRGHQFWMVLTYRQGFNGVTAGTTTSVRPANVRQRRRLAGSSISFQAGQRRHDFSWIGLLLGCGHEIARHWQSAYRVVFGRTEGDAQRPRFEHSNIACIVSRHRILPI